jgi:hypothetical protein
VIDPKLSIGLWIWEAAGDVWFDCVRLEEIKSVK